MSFGPFPNDPGLGGGLKSSPVDGQFVTSIPILDIWNFASDFGVAVDANHFYYSAPDSVAPSNTWQIWRTDKNGNNSANSPATLLFGGLASTDGVALAVDASHLYYATTAGIIGRSNLDGSGRVDNWITTGLAANGLSGIVVDAAHIYWGTRNPPSTSGQNGVGRANIDGTGATNFWINMPALGGGAFARPLDVYVNSQYVVIFTGGPVVGRNPTYRANLDGSNLIALPTPPNALSGALLGGVAIDENYIWWADPQGSGVGGGPAHYPWPIYRTNLDGSNPALVARLSAIGNYSAVDNTYVYFSSIGGAGRLRKDNSSIPYDISQTWQLGRTLRNQSVIGSLDETAPALASYGFTQSQATGLLVLVRTLVEDLNATDGVLAQLLVDLGAVG